jgi:UDP-N-acetylmuramate--alanine ligase
MITPDTGVVWCFEELKMPISVSFDGKPFHFIGVGGIGMSALAYILTKRDLPVSGSDVRLTHITRRLQDSGAKIFVPQEAKNLDYFLPPVHPSSYASTHAEMPWSSGTTSRNPIGKEHPPQVICSTAIDARNPEYRAALERGYPIFHRSDVLAALIQEYDSIAVAGTHGKTTTSSMIGHLLLGAGLDPTIVVGGEVTSWGGNAHLGQGPHLVAEADESDGTLAKLSASIGIVTNIELDHTDHYHSLQDVVETFQTFQRQCQTLIASIDCHVVRGSLQPTITYSLNPASGADYWVTDISYHADGTLATVWEQGKPVGQISLRVLGEHNLSNALAAVAVGRYVGLDFDDIVRVMAQFRGARRRFEKRGTYAGIQFFDDYAHHPSEIRATLAAARLKVNQTNVTPIYKRNDRRTAEGHRVVAVFQPHRFSRTAALLDAFAQAFVDADQVIITDIYSAGETNTFGVSGQQMAEVVARSHPNVLYGATLDQVQALLEEQLMADDLVLFMGAGNLNQIIPQVMAYFADAETPSLQEVC